MGTLLRGVGRHFYACLGRTIVEAADIRLRHERENPGASRLFMQFCLAPFSAMTALSG